MLLAYRATDTRTLITFRFLSTLGSDDEIEEYADLSPEETRERLSKLFPMMDENADGKVDEAELTNHVIKSFQYV